MNTDLVRILIIGAVALALYYVVTYQTAIENQGEVIVSHGLTEKYQASLQDQESQSATMPRYKPATDNPAAGQPQIDNTLNAMSNLPQFAQKPDTYAYDFQPGVEPPRANQLNVV